jgi:hypothetical protein
MVASSLALLTGSDLLVLLSDQPYRLTGSMVSPVPESLPSDAVTFTRRTTVAAVPFIALAGCRWGPEEAASPAVEQAQDADADLVKTVAEAIAQTSALVSSVADEHIGLALSLAPLTAMHTEHLRVLSPNTLKAGQPSPTADSRSALATIRRDEARLQTQLADLATSAVSGTLARALASMSASIAQHLAVLPEITRGPA